MTNEKIDTQEYFNKFYNLIETIKSNADDFHNVAPLLPLVFALKGKPYTLKDHFVFEPFFNLHTPKSQVWITGRQVSKSTSSAAESIVRAGMLPHYNILHITPFNDQIIRLSGNYIYDFLKYSPMQQFFLGDQPLSKKQVTFRNGSRLLFSFASDDCTRIRGINADCVHYDEWQDMDPSFEPEINATTAASPEPLFQKTGTPKTLDNPMEDAWQRSSQAEWIIRCTHCGAWNVPSLDDGQLNAMLGPQVPKWDISKDQPGICCHKCGKWLFPRNGHWYHRFPERRFDCAGYHVPQIIMPMHCESSSKWNLLKSYQAGANNTTQAKFYNEICGISYDEGSKLVSITDLKKVSTIPLDHWEADSLQKAIKYTKQRQYVDLALGVDWGGGGRTRTSFTTVALVGLCSDGTIEVPWGWRSLKPNEPTIEANEVKFLFRETGAAFIAHDFCGSGSIREIVLNELGIPDYNIAPVMYFRVTNKPLVTKSKNYDPNSLIKDFYAVQKARSIAFLCAAIRAGKIKFFQFDFKNTENAGLLYDFMSLVEDKVDGSAGSDIYNIIRSPKSGLPDDFVHAVNYPTMLLYAKHNKWPDVTTILGTRTVDPKSEGIMITYENFK